MKLDMDLGREILLQVEADEHPSSWKSIETEDYTKEQVSYHIKMLAQAGLVEAQNTSSMGSFEWQVTSLTWAGHQFLDAARNDTTWNQAKDLVVEKTGVLTFEGLKMALATLLRGTFGG